MKNKGRKLFSIWDVAIIIVVIAASVFALLSQFNKDENNLTCVVRVNGEIVHTVSLDNVKEQQHYVTDTELSVTVVISDESVRVQSADCPDKLCEHTGEITRSGQSIVCLPAKVTVTLESKNNEVDAVVR